MQDQGNAVALERSMDPLERNQQELFSQCKNTFEAFKGLGDVAEDMRILSLNAELAAGRAGTYGVSIRALTQYTRELVNRLEQINLEMLKVETFNEVLDEEPLKALEKKSKDKSDRESRTVEAEDKDEKEDESNVVSLEDRPTSIDDVEDVSDMMAAIRTFEKEHGGVKYLNEQAKRIAEVVSQSNSIATNMAIEAATAGQYEGTFTNVADDMRGFVNTLKNMVTRAQDSIEKAFRAEKAIKDLKAAKD